MIDKEKLKTSDVQPHLESPYSFGQEELAALSLYLRKKTFEVCIQSGTGHIGGSSSSVELMTALYFGGILQYEPENLRHPSRDRVLVRGHLGPLRYSIFSLLGSVKEEELPTYREFGSRLQGHEEHQLIEGIDISPSGSLGMLLSYGVGSAIAAKKSSREYKTYVFLGDGEEQEGNVAEAARHAGALNLENLIVILDKNGKQLSDPTSQTDNTDLIKVWSGYGWQTMEIKDGHNLQEILSVFESAKNTKGPVFILANTIKGYGLEGSEEHFSGYHTIGVCPPEIAQAALGLLSHDVEQKSEIINGLKKSILPETRKSHSLEHTFQKLDLNIQPLTSTSRNLDRAQGEYFIRLGEFLQNSEKTVPFFFLTADVLKQNDRSKLKLEEYANFFNVGIREQHSIALAHGLSLSYPESRIVINSNDVFAYRSIDQLHSLNMGGGSVIILGDIAGLTNGKNGKTHQSTGQPGALISMPGLEVLEPADVFDTFNALNWSIGSSRGPVYLRLHRSNAIDIPKYVQNDDELLKYYPCKLSESPELTIVASGLTTQYAIEAATVLDGLQVPTQVINVVNQKSLDESFAKLLPEGKPILTVYNGSGRVLQSSVSNAILEHGHARPSRIYGHGFDIGTSGSVADLLHEYKLDRDGIVDTALYRLVHLR